MNILGMYILSVEPLHNFAGLSKAKTYSVNMVNDKPFFYANKTRFNHKWIEKHWQRGNIKVRYRDYAEFVQQEVEHKPQNLRLVQGG